jgi:hypothetical protein
MTYTENACKLLNLLRNFRMCNYTLSINVDRFSNC